MTTITKFYLGIDVSKLWFDVSLLPVDNHIKKDMVTNRFDNNPAGMKLFKKWLTSNYVVFNENSLLVM